MSGVEDNLQENTERDIYGSFLLGESEFAISVKSIQEVVNEPSEYKSIPLAPDFLLGLFNLRGMIIPVIDLGVIFNISEAEPRKDRKVAIIEHEGLCVGILFDSTCEVFDGNRVDKCHFMESNNDIKSQVVKGLFKMNGGSRVIQIIDPSEVLNLKDVPKSDEGVAEKFKREKKGKKKQCISFQVGSCLCAISINEIQEIVMVGTIDTTVLSCDICFGSIWVREHTVPVINFEKVLGQKSSSVDSISSDDGYRIVIMRLGDGLFGLLVNSVESIVSYFDEDVLPFPVLSKDKKEMFKGCITFDENKETILLDHTHILSHSEVTRITRGHKNLYQNDTEDMKGSEKVHGEKETYITFSIDNNYALEISEVKEVIDYPEEILTPPNLSSFVKGMFNLRGKLVAIIDPRAMYSIESSKQVKDPKLLIFQSEDVLYGLIVDSIDSIVSFYEHEKVKIPELIYKGKDGSISHDVIEAIQVNGGVEEEKNLLVLNIAGLSQKITGRLAS